jgi:hypothetical protein
MAHHVMKVEGVIEGVIIVAEWILAADPLLVEIIIEKAAETIHQHVGVLADEILLLLVAEIIQDLDPQLTGTEIPDLQHADIEASEHCLECMPKFEGIN